MPVPVSVSEIRADGWTALTDASGTDWMPTKDPATHRYFDALQPGYGTDGLPATHADRIVLTRQLRTPATATRIAVSALTNYVLQGATVPGAVNNSALTGAKPHCRWALPDRRVVGNTLVAEVVAVHHAARNGQPVAAVTFSATDGVNTVTQTVGVMTISPKSRPGLAVPVYRCSLDISTLSDNADITLNATVFPWIGTAAAVRSSTEETDRWRFSPRYYRRSTVDAATPRIAVVKPSTGSSSGVVSRDPAAARAAPFASIGQAMVWFKNNAIPIDGTEIWIAESMSGTWQTGSSNRIPQRLAAMKITRDPTVDRASAVLTGTGGLAYLGRDETVLGLPVGCIEFGDLTVASISTGVQQVGELDFDGPALASGMNIGTGSSVRVYHLDHQTTASLGGNVQILRGVSKENNSNASNGFDPRAVIGSRIGNAGTPRTTAVAGSPMPAFYVCSEFPDWRASNTSLAYADAECVVQCVIEVMAAGNVNPIAVSADEGTASTFHYVEMHNTLAGAGPGQTRSNTRYDETSTVARTHTYITDKANIWGCMRASKGDLFTGRADRTGNWEFSFGVNKYGNFIYYLTNFPHEFDGIGSRVGDVGVSGFPAAGFANNASAGGTTLANGDYEITNGADSPCWNTIPGELLLAYDLRGNPRTRTDAGAIRIASAGEISGSASGVLSLAGSAEGTATAAGEAAGQLPLSGAAAATVGIFGQALGTLPLSGSAAGTIAVPPIEGEIIGVAAGVLPFTGAATGGLAVAGVATGGLPLSGTAAGVITAPAVSGRRRALPAQSRNRPRIISGTHNASNYLGFGMQTFSIGRGDTGPALLLALGNPAVSLVGASVVFNMAQFMTRVPVILRAPASIEPGVEPLVAYEWQPSDTAVPGNYRAEFEVTFADGSVETYPNGEPLLVVISQDLG